MKKHKKLKSVIYIQHWGTYRDDTIVCINASFKMVLSFLKRVKNCRPEIIKDFESRNESWDEHTKNNPAFMLVVKKVKSSYLWLKEWDNSWQAGDNLIHETNHLIYDMLAESKGMGDEREAMAYQQEFLCKSIRDELNKRFYGKRIRTR